ncbi:MAG: cupin domain-containing protein [Candidatus Eremiobacteraeota bacterium]|nr:cupin domain-containing protein [Candidatus Eremiobacteraeota bacterium]
MRSKEGRLSYGRRISEALGRRPESMDLLERHPFDVEMLRIPPHSVPYRYHSHSAQWEYYQVVSGIGTVRHAGGQTPIVSGDAFIFKPNEPHQLLNDTDEDLVVMVIADNPIGDAGYYPDDQMWLVTSPERRYLALHPEREKDA